MTSFAEVAALRQSIGNGPIAVVTSLRSLTAGIGRDLLMQWAGDPRNLVVFTGTCGLCGGANACCVRKRTLTNLAHGNDVHALCLPMQTPPD